MKSEQLVLTHTGGGCTGLRFDLPDGYYLLLTDAADDGAAYAPSNNDDPCTLWLFSPYHSEEIARRDFNTLHEFHAAWAQWDGDNETLETLFD